MEPDLDKQINMTSKDNLVFRKEVNALLDSIDSVDARRVQNPNIRRYTWHSRSKSSRLDYFFISEHLLNEINKCSISTGLHSDHSIVNLELNRNKLNRVKGFWKFNSNLLYDIKYVKLIKTTVAECTLNLNHYSDKGLIWELTKLKTRSVFIPYLLRKRKTRML